MSSINPSFGIPSPFMQAEKKSSNSTSSSQEGNLDGHTIKPFDQEKETVVVNEIREKEEITVTSDEIVDEDKGETVEAREISTEEAKDSEEPNKSSSDKWKLIALAVVAVGMAILGVGVIVGIAASPIGIGFGLLALGALVTISGVGIIEFTGPQGQDEASSEFMNRFSGDCDSYAMVLKGFTTEGGANPPPTTLEKVLAKNKLAASKTLKNLNQAYKDLNPRFTDNTMPKKAPDGWKIEGKNLEEKEANIRDLKLSKKQKKELEAEGFSTKDIKNYETYWKNFLLLKAAQFDSAGGKFFKQPGT